jgi:hypothetical protein
MNNNYRHKKYLVFTRESDSESWVIKYESDSQSEVVDWLQSAPTIYGEYLLVQRLPAWDIVIEENGEVNVSRI